MKVIITESHLKHLIDLLKEDIRPLQKLMECKVTKDFKYILFDGKFYSTKTGNEVTLNEGWLTNVLQTGGDLISMGLDFALPGTGAVVDTLIGIGMIIAAQFKTGEAQDSLYLMAAIQFALVLLPGPLQLIGTTLRRALKSGKGLATPVVKKGLGIISGAFTTIMNGLNAIVQKALSSPLAKRVIGKWGKKINELITKFKNRVKTIFDSFKSKTPKPINPPKASTETLPRNLSNQTKSSSNSDDYARIVTGPSKKVPDDYAQIWNNNSMIVSNKQNKFTSPNGSNALPPSTSKTGKEISNPSQMTPGEAPSLTNNGPLPPSVEKGTSGLPPSTQKGPSGLPPSETSANMPRKSLSTTQTLDTNNFKKRFKTDRRYGINELPDSLNSALKNTKFTSKDVDVLVKTTHSSGQKAVQVATPNNSRLLLYQDKDTWVPIEGYDGNIAKPMKGVENNQYINDLIQFLNKHGIEKLG
jgi:hypothetical protein